MKKKVCVICGKPTGIPPAKLRRYKNPTCSPACKAALIERERAAKAKYTHCAHCGAKLNHIQKTGDFNPNKRFCDRTCAGKWGGQDKDSRAKWLAKREDAIIKRRIDGGGLWFEIKNVMPHTPWDRLQFDGMNPLDPAVTLCGPWAARNGVECGA